MKKRLTTEEFIRRAKIIHNNKYDYSKVVYINAWTPIVIICPIHGEFSQTPCVHLRGSGCKKCARTESKNGKICGVGINDIKDFVKDLSYKTWYNLILRCYNEFSINRNPTYKDCSVCEEWLIFSNFKDWFDKNYVEGYDLDKDILVKGNKVYSPNTCCFVPQEINKLIINQKRNRGLLPIGVVKKQDGKFVAQISKNKKRVTLGRFLTVNDAFAAYKKEKESYIKEVAQKYFNDGKITKRVYDALMRYEVEITD